MALTGSRRATTQTNSFETLSFNVAASGSYTLTPARTGFVISPYSQSFTNVNADKTANFTATQVTNSFSISGRVSLGANSIEGISSIQVRLSGTQSGSTLTDRLGNHSFTNLAPGGNLHRNRAVELNLKFYTSVAHLQQLEQQSDGKLRRRKRL